MKPFYIDDSGLATLVGGTLVGAYNAMTGRFDVRTIPVTAFRDPNPADCGKALSQQVKSLVGSFANEGQRIVICRGSCFDRAEIDLRELGYAVERDKIEDPLQSWLRDEHFKHLDDELGVPLKDSRGNYVGRDTWYLADWVAQDFPHRESLVKNAHKSWQQTYRLFCENRYNSYYLRKSARRN